MMKSTIVVAATLLALGCSGAVQAQQPGGPTGPGQIAPDTRTIRAADEQMNHPRKNHRSRHCSYHRNALGKKVRHCTWK